MNPLTEARQAVAAALAGLGVPVHPTPVGPVPGPAVILRPHTGTWFDGSGVVRLDVMCLAGSIAGLERLERLVIDSRAALRAAGINPGDVDGPDEFRDQGRIAAIYSVRVRTTCA